jgi:hypothetical protein
MYGPPLPRTRIDTDLDRLAPAAEPGRKKSGAAWSPAAESNSLEIIGVQVNVNSAQPAAIRIQLLGDFILFHSRAPVPVRRCGQRLLAFLGINQHPVARSRIAGTLWPESAGTQASANLRAALSRLFHIGTRFEPVLRHRVVAHVSLKMLGNTGRSGVVAPHIGQIDPLFKFSYAA